MQINISSIPHISSVEYESSNGQELEYHFETYGDQTSQNSSNPMQNDHLIGKLSEEETNYQPEHNNINMKDSNDDIKHITNKFKLDINNHLDINDNINQFRTDSSLHTKQRNGLSNLTCKQVDLIGDKLELKL